MSITAGVFTALQLLNVKTDIAKMFRENLIDAHVNKPPVIFKELAENQSFQLSREEAKILIDGRLCNSVVAHWIADCDVTVNDDTDLADSAADCIIDGIEAGADSKTYAPNTKFHRDGKVVVSNCKDAMEAGQKLARKLANDMAVLDYELEKRVAAALLANPMTLDASFTSQVATSTLQATNTIWDIPAAKWTYDLIADFKIMADYKQFINPKLISGANLYREAFLAPFKDGDGDLYATLLGPNRPLPLVNNLFDLDSTTAEASTFIVDNANFGYFNTYKQPDQMRIEEDSDRTRLFNVSSNRLSWRNGSSLSPVKYDVRMHYKCIGEDEYAFVYRMKHNGGIVWGPDTCATGHTGVIHVVKDYTP